MNDRKDLHTREIKVKAPQARLSLYESMPRTMPGHTQPPPLGSVCKFLTSLVSILQKNGFQSQKVCEKPVSIPLVSHRKQKIQVLRSPELSHLA